MGILNLASQHTLVLVTLVPIVACMNLSTHTLILGSTRLDSPLMRGGAAGAAVKWNSLLAGRRLARGLSSTDK